MSTLYRYVYATYVGILTKLSKLYPYFASIPFETVVLFRLLFFSDIISYVKFNTCKTAIHLTRISSAN